jgi:hypothetical protein
MAKRNPGGHHYLCPAAISEAALAEISRNTLAAHRALALLGILRLLLHLLLSGGADRDRITTAFSTVGGQR